MNPVKNAYEDPERNSIMNGSKYILEWSIPEWASRKVVSGGYRI